MNIGMDLEIHFHQQEEASVYLESNVDGRIEMFGEILLFCTYALRNMANFGHDDPENIAFSIAHTLKNVSNKIDIIENMGGAKLVKYEGTPGRKRFLASLRFRDNDFKFYNKTKGFGLFAKGMGYYSPNSIFILLKYLVSSRIQDKEYLNRLSMAMELCGNCVINKELTVMNQKSHAMNTALRAGFPFTMETPKTAEDFCDRGHGHKQLGNYEDALADYSKAIDLKPDYEEAIFNRAVTYDFDGNIQKAISEYEKAIMINPENADAFYNLGYLYSQELKDYQSAIDNYLKAIKTNPHCVDAFINLGVIYTEKFKNLPKALEVYNEGINENQKDPTLYKNRAVVYHKMGNEEQALQDLHNAAKLGDSESQQYLRK